MTLFSTICIINILTVICISPILTQENGNFWWLNLNPDVGGDLAESSGEVDAENGDDFDQVNNGFLPATSSKGFTPGPQDGVPNTPRTTQLGESKVVNMPQKSSNNDEESDCVCVEYYLCNSNNTVITNGEGGLFDVRLGENRVKCPGIQVCCKLPDVTTRSPVTKKPMVCGEIGGGFVSRILNYNDENSTQFSEFPWMVALLKSNKLPGGEMQNNMFQCGASLIHPQVVLTAAHCVNSYQVSQLKIRAGEWDTKESLEPIPHQERNVTQIIVHPDFYSGALYNDLALLVLDRPLQIVVNVLPICLPQQDAVFDARRCVATGWGRDAMGKAGKFQSTLKKVELPIVPSDVCQDKLRLTRLGKYFRLHQSFVCAGGELGRDTCEGDGGGPLACYDPALKAYVQVGIVSWGIGCGDSRIPAVYTNVPRFRKWIDEYLLQLGFF